MRFPDTSISKVYTKKGDKGKTHLRGGREVSKDNIRIEAFGTIDELNSFAGALSGLWFISLKKRESPEPC